MNATAHIVALLKRKPFKMAKDGETPAKAVGGFIGIAGRYATISAIAWWGGFWA